MPQPRTSKSSDERGPARRRAPIVISIALAATAAVTVAILLIGGSGDSSGKTIELVIPKGTSARLDAGKPVAAIPDRIEGHVGDTLLIKNNDSVTQFVSGFAVSPGQEVNIPLAREGTYATSCSAHKDKSIEMVVKS